jgi:hypothetical protein
MGEPESNIPNALQVDLFDESMLPAGRELLSLEEDAKRGRFTGEIVARNRERYARIVRCLAEGIGIRATARAFGCSTSTVQAIRDREGLAIGTEKKELSTKLGHFARMAGERLIEELDNIPIGQLPVAMGIALDKKAQLDGEASAIVEHRTRREPDPEDIRAYLAGLRSATPKPEELGSTVGSGDGEPAQLPAPQDEGSQSK